MFQLFDPGLDSFIVRFRRPPIIVLPVIGKTCITLCLYINRVAETADPAFSENIRVDTAFKEDAPYSHAGRMLLVKVSFELFCKTDRILCGTLHVAVL